MQVDIFTVIQSTKETGMQTVLYVPQSWLHMAPLGAKIELLQEKQPKLVGVGIFINSNG